MYAGDEYYDDEVTSGLAVEADEDLLDADEDEEVEYEAFHVGFEEYEPNPYDGTYSEE